MFMYAYMYMFMYNMYMYMYIHMYGYMYVYSVLLMCSLPCRVHVCLPRAMALSCRSQSQVHPCSTFSLAPLCKQRCQVQLPPRGQCTLAPALFPNSVARCIGTLLLNHLVLSPETMSVPEFAESLSYSKLVLLSLEGSAD